MASKTSAYYDEINGKEADIRVRDGKCERKDVWGKGKSFRRRKLQLKVSNFRGRDRATNYLLAYVDDDYYFLKINPLPPLFVTKPRIISNRGVNSNRKPVSFLNMPIDINIETDRK